MAVVIASNLRKELSGSRLFDGVSFSVDRRDRVALAVWRGDRVAAAETCARCGARWQEADFRLPAAAQLRARGDVAAADEQRRLALAFYRSVGATQRIREADALLAATA